MSCVKVLDPVTQMLHFTLKNEWKSKQSHRRLIKIWWMNWRLGWTRLYKNIDASCSKTFGSCAVALIFTLVKNLSMIKYLHLVKYSKMVQTTIQYSRLWRPQDSSQRVTILSEAPPNFILSRSTLVCRNLSGGISVRQTSSSSESDESAVRE